MASSSILGTYRRSPSAIALVTALALAHAGTAFAATGPEAAAPTADAAPAAAPEQPQPGEIMVTARKTSESILKTPIAITALTSTQLKARGVRSMADIADYTPGMNISDVGASRNDRSFQNIIIRGFTPPSAVAQTTSVFIDGAPVSSATAVTNITDPERVEILKGPQSAYFGRQTFAGAVNIVTRAPTDRWSGNLDLMFGTHGNRDITAEVSGPLINDVLGMRATFREYAKDGSYHNSGNTGQTLGDQETKTGTLALVFKPASNFTARFFGLITRNDDGPSAQGLISPYTYKNAAGKTIVQGQSNCTVNGHAYECGVLPGLAAGQPGVNTDNNAFITNFLSNSTGRLVSPSEGVQGYGLRSQFYHLHLGMDWQLGDIKLSSLTAYNNERISELSDLDDYYDTTVPNNAFGTIPGAQTYFEFPYLVEDKTHDWSQELRANYSTSRLKATVGVSYLDARYQNGLGGGNGALGTTTFSSVNGATRNRTMGAFFGLGYNITNSLSLNFDGRYQIDHLYAYAPPAGVTITSNQFTTVGTYAGNSLLAQKSYHNFMPRVIAQYNFTPHDMFYVSYSQGVNPATFNTQFLTLSSYVQSVAAKDGYKIVVDPEKLENWEIGLKGQLFGRHVSYQIAAYRAIWKNQINSSNISVFDPTTNTTSVITAALNAGRVRMTGVEGQIDALLMAGLTMDLAGAINDSHIETLDAPTVTALTGISDFSGKQDPQTSKYSGTVSLQYEHPLSSQTDATGYIRGDFVYKSGVYTDAANLLRTPDYTNFNVRLGAKNERVAIELFVTNLFDNRAYQSATPGALLTSNFQYSGVNSAVIVGLRDLRAFGVRLHYSM